MPKARFAVVVLIGLGIAAAPAVQARAKNDNTAPANDQSSASKGSGQDSSNPLTRPLSDKQRFRQQKQLRQELKGPYKKWIDQDVRWIITPQELKAFKSLTNDEERDAFIEQFWQRRNPNPDSPVNTAREEHYRRIAYADEHFAAGEPGWETDRGRIYIMYGKPDSIDSHPSGGLYERPMSEGGGETSTYPFEIWHYRYLDGIGENVNIEFVDQCMCGAYKMTLDRSAKDALKHVPGAGPTLFEQMGLAKRSDRFKGGLEQLGLGPMSSEEQAKEFDRLERFAKLQAPPKIKFTDLEGFLVNHKLLTGPFFPFEVRVDYVKLTDDTVLVPITMQIKNRNITFVTKDGVATGKVNVLGRISTITDHVVQTFEQTLAVEEPAELMGQQLKRASVHWWAFPLRPGRYRIDIAIKDVNNPDHVGTWARGIVVPRYNDNTLSTSSLILADKMQMVPTKQIGAGQFIIGDTFVRPRVSGGPKDPATFQRNQKLNFWMQVYNLGINDKTKRNSATIHYQIVNLGSHKTLLNSSETSAEVGTNSANADQLTLEKSLSLASLEPGKYQVKIQVDDHITNQQVAESAPFIVE